MGLTVLCLENQLMKSNCYIVADRVSKACLIIDPASEKSEREIIYVEDSGLHLDYIILTHEHSDHTWGANALKERFSDSKIVCSELCDKYAKKSSKAYFLLYYDKKGYRYELFPADIVIHTSEATLKWNNLDIHFILTPGHSFGSMCIEIDGKLFTGDTIMPFKPYFNGRDSKEDDWIISIEKILKKYPSEMEIMPGHGESLNLEKWKHNYYSIL